MTNPVATKAIATKATTIRTVTFLFILHLLPMSYLWGLEGYYSSVKQIVKQKTLFNKTIDYDMGYESLIGISS